jgi:folate-binding protein YgfZ
MPDRLETACFSNLNDEYGAALDSAAVFDISDRTRLQMMGPDAASFLHRFCTNQVQALPPGLGCEAFLCNIKGRILGHVLAFVGEAAVRIDTSPGQADALMSHLDKYHLLENFRLEDVSSATYSFLVSGPQAVETLSAAGFDTAPLQPIAWQVFGDVAVRRVDLLGVPGFLVDGPIDSGDEVWQRLAAAGAVPAGREALTALRIEAGFPQYAVDVSDDNLAQEANRTDKAISFNKGCYLGQEPIARLHAMGHVNRELVCFEIEPPADTSAVESASIPGLVLSHPDKPDKQIGTLTSTAWSPGRGKAVGLGMLRSQFATPGTEVPTAVGGMARVIERRLAGNY